MPRPLSSRLTILYKFILLPFWITIYGGAIVLILSMPDSEVTGGERQLFLTVFPLIGVAGAIFFAWLFLPLKKVELEGASLRISNFAHRITVPLAEVEAVSGSILMNPDLIWVRFHHPTEFGVKIVFAAPYRFFAGWGRHSLVHELQALVAAPNHK
ncbi:MAG: hypothetical protein AB1486_27050 [Planctomycetota bacterium]